jgi:hypothetical protein
MSEQTVSDKASEVPPYDAMPCCAFAAVELEESARFSELAIR